MDFNITSHKYDNILSKTYFQGAGLKVKVTVAICRKNFVMALVPTCINGF